MLQNVESVKHSLKMRGGAVDLDGVECAQSVKSVKHSSEMGERLMDCNGVECCKM